MQILHLALDEKFIPLAIDLFEEAFPECNFFRVIKNSERHYCKESTNTIILPRDSKIDSSFRKDLVNCQILVVHSMRPLFVRAIEACRKESLIVWSGWGMEYVKFLEAQLGNPLLAASRQFVALKKKRGRKASATTKS